MFINEISIKNFRSIEYGAISDINEALILIGKNNSGKSSILTSIRAFFKDYDVKITDFPPEKDQIEIKISFKLDDDYLKNFIFHPKIGILKIPSNAAEFNDIKVGTVYSDEIFNSFKEIRSEAIIEITETDSFIETYSSVYNLWLKCIKKRFNVDDNKLVSIAKISKENDLKLKYYGLNSNEIKDIEALFPKLSYIHDERNFSEEEVGKSKTLTHNIFSNQILKKSRNSNSGNDFANIENKSIGELTIDDLEFLTEIKLNEISHNTSEKISEFFQSNYRDDYCVKINSTCDLDKSISINTLISDPNIEEDLKISNVGAGLRNIYNLSLLQAYNQILKEDSTHHGTNLYLLEEPEIYLHPSLQKEMCSTLREISQSEQIFFTTHSPLLIKDFENNQIRKTYLGDDFKTTISDTDLSEILNEIGYSTTDILDTDFVIIVEGRHDEERLKLILDRFYNINSEKVYFVQAKSCANIETYATLKFLNKTTLKENFAIIRDSDTEDITRLSSSLINKYKENLGVEFCEGVDSKILILKYSALDNYFLNPETLVELYVIPDETIFYQRINDYLSNNESTVRDYLHKHNGDERAELLIHKICNDMDVEDKLEDIKKYVRGHNLFGIFKSRLNSKIDRYINETDESDFVEITDFFDTFDYFNSRKK